MSRKPYQSVLSEPARSPASQEDPAGHHPQGWGLQSAPSHIVAVESDPEWIDLLQVAVGDQSWVTTVEADAATFADAIGDYAVVDLVLFNYADFHTAPASLGQVLGRLTAPLLMTVASNDEVGDALRAGATATLQKPYPAEVLTLAIVGLLRRFGGLRTMLSESVQLGDLTVALANHTIDRRGQKQVLSPTEWQLFAYLLAHPGRVFTRYELARGAWGPAYGDRLAQTELYISRLRRKIEPDPRNPEIIETVRGQGYRLRAQPTRAGAPGALEDGSARLLDGETESSDSPSTIAHWKRAYSQLVDAKHHLIVSARDQLDRLMPDVQHEIVSNDICVLESDLSHLQQRLDMWTRRLDATTSYIPGVRVVAGGQPSGRPLS